MGNIGRQLAMVSRGVILILGSIFTALAQTDRYLCNEECSHSSHVV